MIVNNESDDIVSMLNREFDELAKRHIHDLEPQELMIEYNSM